MRYLVTFVLFLSLFCVHFAVAQPVLPTGTEKFEHMRISYVMCYPGMETWETFGHSCIRIVDSTAEGAERDKIYNYGFFEVSEGNSIWKQVFTGRVIDLLDTITYEELMAEYTFKGRGLEELELNLNASQKEKVYHYLRDNLRRERRYYEFDSFYDNCTTRIADLFYDLFGEHFVPGKILPEGKYITYRALTVGPLCSRQRKYWTGLATNLIYGSPADKVINEREALHFPPFLFEALQGASIDGNPVGGDVTWIQKDKVQWDNGVNWPLILFNITALLLLLSIVYVRNLRPLYFVLSNLILILSGIIGCILLYTSTFDGDPAWKYNYNILWALPTNIIVPFLIAPLKKWYCLIALCAIFIVTGVNLARIQIMPLDTIGPLLFSLLLVYSFEYKK